MPAVKQKRCFGRVADTNWSRITIMSICFLRAPGLCKIVHQLLASTCKLSKPMSHSRKGWILAEQSAQTSQALLYNKDALMAWPTPHFFVLFGVQCRAFPPCEQAWREKGLL